MDKNARIYVAGHRGLVGSALVDALRGKGYDNLLLRTHAELDLTRQQAVEEFFAATQPDYVFLAAAKVGGILANDRYRADFIHQNLQIQNHVIHQSYTHGVKKLLFLGSTCIYPKNAPQPILEQALLSGELEYTNESYAIAKIAGIKLCESYNQQYGTNFIAVMPTNLYGPRDNFDLETSHVLPALVRKMHLAKLLSEGRERDILRDLQVDCFDRATVLLARFGISADAVEIWSDGSPRREFLWSEDLADACLFLMQNYDSPSGRDQVPSACRNAHVNVGTGYDISIRDLAEMIQKTVGYPGHLVFNADKPSGTRQKLTDVSRLHGMGWRHRTELQEGIANIYRWWVRRPGEGPADF